MRKPKQETPLRQVRQASGQSQKAFAAYLGLGLHLYHSLELGRVKLTRDNAKSIAQKTGANPDSLNPEISRLALNMDGAPYTNESWESWQGGHSLWPWQRAIDLLQWTEFLCRIAEREGKLAELCFDLCDCLTKAKDKFDLCSTINREFASTKACMGFLCKYGDLRANKELARRVGFTEVEGTSNDTVWSKVITYIPTWSPHSLLPPELAERFKLSDQLTPRRPNAASHQKRGCRSKS